MWLRRNKHLTLQLVTILFLILRKTVISSEYSIDVYQNVYIPESMCAIVPCKFVADSRQKFLNTKGLWMQGRSVIASSDMSEGTKQNFHAIGNPNDGDCSLKIVNARKEDGGTYIFRFEESKNSIIKYTYSNIPITVQVTDIRDIDGYSIQLDQAVIVQKGLCVTIPCTFTANYMKSFTNSRGHWKTICNEFVASSDKSIVGIKSNFHLMGNPDNGDCTLMITDANEQDSGRYYFRFENAGDTQKSLSYFSKVVTVKVTDIKEVDGYSIQLNQTVIVQKGLCVTIPCTFTADNMKSFTNSQGHWSTVCHEFVASSNKSIVGIKPHFHLMGNPDNGDCTLMITDANEQDSGRYYFTFEDTNNRRYSYASKMITVKVTDLNEKPVISDPGILTEGKKVTLTCTAPRGCPNALITWYNQTEIWTNATKLTFVPTRSHHQTSLTCQMSLLSSKNYTQNEITLFVQYPPSIIITIETSELTNMTNEEVTVQEGSSLVLNCSAESNTGVQVTWMKGEKNVLSKGTGSELTLYLNNITASGADKYLCLAQNNVGVINETMNIIVKYSTPTNFNMITWITVTVSINLILIGLGIFCFVRCAKKKESGHENSIFERELKRRNPTDLIDDEPENIYANM